jgi:hypothetical protein
MGRLWWAVIVLVVLGCGSSGHTSGSGGSGVATGVAGSGGLAGNPASGGSIGTSGSIGTGGSIGAGGSAGRGGSAGAGGRGGGTAGAAGQAGATGLGGRGGAAGQAGHGGGGAAGQGGLTGGIDFGDGGTCDHTLANPNCWSAFGTSALHPKGLFRGGGFDGRYLYLVSSGDATLNPITRYDTQGDFAAPSSWTAFNLSSVNTDTPDFYGALFDGRYMYFLPCDPGFGSTLSRYDTRMDFTTAAAWSNFGMTAVNGNPAGDGQCEIGGLFDGRYAYFIPNSIYGYWRGTMARFDTQGSFQDVAGAWSVFNTQSLAATAAGYVGGAFDGRYIYLTPCCDASTGTPLALQGPPLITRLDTRGTFTDAGAWKTFDPTPLGPTNNFLGAAFDGRYVYFPPGDYRGHATRYDTTLDFTASASWSTFDMTTLGGGINNPFNGARFDGRYLYFLPSSGVIVRYDTTKSFAASASWETLNLTTLNAAASTFDGAVFDGHYLYLVPYSGNLVMRFDTGGAGTLPAQSNASFL